MVFRKSKLSSGDIKNYKRELLASCLYIKYYTEKNVITLCTSCCEFCEDAEISIYNVTINRWICVEFVESIYLCKLLDSHVTSHSFHTRFVITFEVQCNKQEIHTSKILCLIWLVQSHCHLLVVVQYSRHKSLQQCALCVHSVCTACSSVGLLD